MSIKVDPFLHPIPTKLLNDPETQGFFTYLTRWCNQIWNRTGAGTDTIQNNVDGLATANANIATNTTNIATNVTNIAANDADISALDTRVSVIESDIIDNTALINQNISDIADNATEIRQLSHLLSEISMLRKYIKHIEERIDSGT